MSGAFSFSSWTAKNPLGFVALFISLIYGMSALLLGAAVGSLTVVNQTILVIFIVIFPFVVLSVFSWLVANHHRKLYGPGDFRSDESFLNASNFLPPSAIGERLRREIEEEEETDENKSVGGKKSDTTTHQPAPKKNIVGLRHNTDSLVASGYFAESLVFQELQNEIGGAVRRSVRLRDSSGRQIEVDGILQAGQQIFVIEVKVFRFSSHIDRRLRELAIQINKYRNVLLNSEFKAAQIILALVFMENVPPSYSVEAIERHRASLGDNVIIRIFSFSDLTRKYGIPNPEFHFAG
jgi:hypothetical protein